MIRNSKLLVSMACLMALASACKKDYFDQEGYDARVRASFPVRNIDPTHTWATFGTCTARVSVGGSAGEQYKVSVYQQDPLCTSPVVMLGSTSVMGGQRTELTFCYELASPVAYVAIFDSKGHRVVQAVEVQDGKTIDVDFFQASRATRANVSDSAYSSYVKARMNFDDILNPAGADVIDLSLVNDYLVLNNETLGSLFDNKSYDGESLHIRVASGTTIHLNHTINGDQGTLNRCVLYIDGTVHLQGGTLRGVTIVIANGGKFFIDGQPNFTSHTRFIVMEGGELHGEMEGEDLYVTFNQADCKGLYNFGTVWFQGEMEFLDGQDGTELYNEGTMYVKNIECNFITNYASLTTDKIERNWALYNQGTLTINGTIESKKITNFGSFTALTSLKNIYEMEIINGCQMHFTSGVTGGNDAGPFGTNKLLMLKNSRLTVDGELRITSQDNGYLQLHDQSLVECQGLRTENGTIVGGPTGEGEVAVVKIDGDIYTNNIGDFKSEGNVYFDWTKAADYVYLNNSQSSAEQLAEFKAQLRNFCSEESSEITIEAGDCTGRGYGTSDDDVDLPQTTGQAYRFCFEDNFPVPGDYDFNDCVLTVTPSVDGSTATVAISLDAVGATKQIAACMRLRGIADADIVSATCTANLDAGIDGQYTDGVLMVPAAITYQKTSGGAIFIKQDNKGIDAQGATITDAVVKLFNDAHWTMSQSVDALLTRRFFNTVPTDNNFYQPVGATYTFQLASEALAQQVNMSNIDIFIIEKHNGRWWEVHTFPFKFDQVVGGPLDGSALSYVGDGTKLDVYKESATANFPWAISVPSPSTKPFRYPIEYQAISSEIPTDGSFTEENAPAYIYFADWAKDKNSTADAVRLWYRNPTNGKVY